MLAVIKKYKWLVALAVALLLSLIVLLNQSPPSEWTEAQRYGERLQSASTFELLMYIGIGVLATAVGLPRQLFAFVSGYAFGAVLGTIMSLAMAIGGCAVAFALARRFLRLPLNQRYSTLVAGIDALAQHDVFWKILMLRFQPLGTNLMTNLAAGVSKINALSFLSASLVGYIPQALVFALIGAGVRVGSRAQLMVSVALLSVSVILGLWLLARSSRRNSVSPL